MDGPRQFMTDVIKFTGAHDHAAHASGSGAGTRMSRLETLDVNAGYAGVNILDGIEVAVPDGQVTILIGPNGCGKSTLLKSLARILKRASSTADFERHRSASANKARRAALV